MSKETEKNKGFHVKNFKLELDLKSVSRVSTKQELRAPFIQEATAAGEITKTGTLTLNWPLQPAMYRQMIMMLLKEDGIGIGEVYFGPVVPDNPTTIKVTDLSRLEVGDKVHIEVILWGSGDQPGAGPNSREYTCVAG